MSWKLVHVDNGENGTTKVYQNENGDVRIDSFMGDVTDSNNHDRFTLNTSNGGSISGHDFNHENKFDSSKENDNTKNK